MRTAPPPRVTRVLCRSLTSLHFLLSPRCHSVQKYMDNPEKTLSAAGIHEGGAQPRLKRVRGFVCDVCFDTAQETLALSCDMRCESLHPLLFPRWSERE